MLPNSYLTSLISSGSEPINNNGSAFTNPAAPSVILTPTTNKAAGGSHTSPPFSAAAPSVSVSMIEVGGGEDCSAAKRIRLEPKAGGLTTQ